ncbi:MAG: YbaK/EbsC family protein [Acidimicrobiales bacterium]
MIERPDGSSADDRRRERSAARVDQIVKSMIFDAGELVLALDQWRQHGRRRRAGCAGGCGEVRPGQRRSAEAETTSFAIGGNVPPFGHTSPIRTWIDPHLMSFDQVWAAAGTPRHVFPIAPNELVRLAGATVADFAQ